MKRVLLLATTTGYQTRSFDEAAVRLGVELVFGLDRCRQLDNPWGDRALAVRYYDDPRSVDAIVSAARDGAISGVLALGDRPTVLAARAARVLGLPFHSPESAAASRNKLATRERLRGAGLPAPWFAAADAAADPHILARQVPFPCVVKPLALSGSRGVIRADGQAAFVAAFERLRRFLHAPDVRTMKDPALQEILVESFIPGVEFAVEGLMHHGTLQVLAVFDKPDPLDGPFFEETIYVTPSAADAQTQQRITDAIVEACAALGLRHGPVHAECRVNPDGVFVLEVAARPIGGLCARALRMSDGNAPVVPFEALLLRHALGEDVRGWRREPCASGVMMIPIPRGGVYRGVRGEDRARAVRLVEEVLITAKPDQHLVPLPEGASYLGFVFARGNSGREVLNALREAHGRLAFQIDRELTIAAPAPVSPARR